MRGLLFDNRSGNIIWLSLYAGYRRQQQPCNENEFLFYK
jgi:hypothetical protein